MLLHCISNQRAALSYMQTDAPTPHIVGPTMLRPAVHNGKDTTHKTLEISVSPAMLEGLCERIQHCSATLRRSWNKRYVGSCRLKSLTGFKLCATTPNDMQQGVQTAATCKIQKCWELLANNRASVCFIKSFMLISSNIDHCAFCKPGTKVILNRPVWQ